MVDLNAKEMFLHEVAQALHANPEWLTDALTVAARAATAGFQNKVMTANQGMWAALALKNQKRLTKDMAATLNELVRVALSKEPSDV